MHIFDEKTRVIARLFPQPNSRGLNIYNPYFAAKDVNAVYLLFANPDVVEAIDGLRKLGLAGAIPAGFEGNPKMVGLMDELTPIAKRMNRVSLIVNQGGKLIGHNNAGQGLAQAIETAKPIKDKRLVIMGAGNVAKGLLAYLESVDKYPTNVAVYNRTPENAKALQSGYKIDEVGSLEDMLAKADGDIFVNTTQVGTPWNKGDGFAFPEQFLKRFSCVADATFVPLKPPLITAAEQAGVATASGWKMFVYQGAQGIHDILNVDIDIELLSKLACKDFETNWD